MAKMLNYDVTIVDLSEPPQGQVQLTRLFGSFLLASLSTELLAREVNEWTEPLVLALDELPELLTKRVTADLERLLALVRHRRVALWMMAQDETQLSSKSAALWPIIQANVRRIKNARHARSCGRSPFDCGCAATNPERVAVGGRRLRYRKVDSRVSF